MKTFYQISVRSKEDHSFSGKVIITAGSAVEAYRFIRSAFSKDYTITGCMLIYQ